MYFLSKIQKKDFREIAVNNELATEKEIIRMTDEEITELFFNHYVPLLVEYPSEEQGGTRREVWIMKKQDFLSKATLLKP